ncbi:hypothetical protein ALISP_7118 [Alicycliphilus sp. B1]|nr:hypothetical protein ALISP_7118 [Alicycliphilus sp. B1]
MPANRAPAAACPPREDPEGIYQRPHPAPMAKLSGSNDGGAGRTSDAVGTVWQQTR